MHAFSIVILTLGGLCALLAVGRPTAQYWLASRAFNWHCFEAEALYIVVGAMVRQNAAHPVALDALLDQADAHLEDAKATMRWFV